MSQVAATAVDVAMPLQIMKALARVVMAGRKGLFGLLKVKLLAWVPCCQIDLGLCWQVEPITAHRRGRVLLAFARQMSAQNEAARPLAGLVRVKCSMNQLLH